MTGPGRLKRISKVLATYGIIVVVTVLLFDVVLIATGLFPPAHDYGVPGIGWVAAQPSDGISDNRCTEFASGTVHHYARNENGYRTSHSARDLEGLGASFEIAVTGDSHTDLCAPNEQTHFGIMEREMRRAGVPAVAFGFGAGRYSPLQAYLAIRNGIDQYAVDALVLNLYTGNDFYDLLRVDDRPHFVQDGGGYRIADPVWYLYDAPGRARRSRVLYVLDSAARATGVRGLYLRLGYLRAAAREQGYGLAPVIAYLDDLRRSTSPDVGYPAAFAAQMLNQQLFFHRFPRARDESMRRVRELLAMIRREHPDLVLVMSPIPSYQVVGEKPVDPALRDVLEGLPIDYEGGVAEEETLYRALQVEAETAGWIFVDNLTALRSRADGPRLYNDFDYHVEPVASEIIGRAQAVALLRQIGSGASASERP